MLVRILLERQISFEHEVTVEAQDIESAKLKALRSAPDLVFYRKNITEHVVLSAREVQKGGDLSV